ncbi:methyltransferase domain-containing protein [Erythrobacter arachoides]|uniref:Methyltransferase domain-containing protein n=1 Tax=Aurantiacibacter arachoides TaxID=1850444 RepID=A0A845A579_9SPHN|nr:transcription antitermination factor NusB [Aurantiacibacter arachoides]MXO94316.1 methyltransferase domain-containing protein [Aurantiacibacter arachoides]GGD64416.1 rRNA methyltransferase [Aurantiacibacter arachoides]
MAQSPSAQTPSTPIAPTPIAGLPPRRAALRMLDAVLRRGETMEQAGGAANGLASFSDRALARAIAGEVLRWLTDLDALIDGATREVLPTDAKVRMVLRMMLAQWLRLATPPHAVVATALPLLDGGPKRLAHGVFATLTRGEVKLPHDPTLPPEVAARWGERAQAIAAGLATPPPLDLSLRDHAQTDAVAEQLGGISLAPGHVRLPRGAGVESLPGFDDGAWWVQDLAATIPARLLGAGSNEGDGRRVLDLCAAPGGKTLQLASMGWQVTALDNSSRRLERLRQNLDRTGLSAAIVEADAMGWHPDAPFDAILLDAPCTATGTCRRNPDVIHRIGPRQIEAAATLQAQLLERAGNWLAPGGTLVYAVCSLEREEGEGVAATCDLPPLPISADELPAGLQPTAEGQVRTDPGMLAEAGGLDGFFIARFRETQA